MKKMHTWNRIKKRRRMILIDVDMLMSRHSGLFLQCLFFLFFFGCFLMCSLATWFAPQSNLPEPLHFFATPYDAHFPFLFHFVRRLPEPLHFFATPYDAHFPFLFHFVRRLGFFAWR
jgi:hypothetical protein